MRVSQTFKVRVHQVQPHPSVDPMWRAQCFMCNWDRSFRYWATAQRYAFIHADTETHQARRGVRLRTRAAVQALFNKRGD